MDQPLDERDDIGKVLNKQGKHSAYDSAEKRIEKLETSVSVLFGLFIGHVLAPLIEAFFLG